MENSNRDIMDFFNNNTQSLRDEEMLLNFENFYLDELGDSIVNQAYDEYEANQFDNSEDVLINQAYDQYLNHEASNAVQHVRRTSNEHDYSRQHVSGYFLQSEIIVKTMSLKN